MKTRMSSHVTLIELTAVLLIFMLASVVILGLFTTAYQKSASARQTTEAVIAARDIGARLTGTGAFEDAIAEIGFTGGAGEYMLDLANEMTVLLKIENEQTEVGKLNTGTIEVLVQGKSVLEYPISRYYNKEVIHP